MASISPRKNPRSVWYIDWCPYATSVLWPVVFEGPSLETSEQIKNHFMDSDRISKKNYIYVNRISNLIDKIYYSYRSDGIFIYCFVPKQNFPNSRLDFEITIKAVSESISHLIKQKLRHIHIYHADYSGDISRRSLSFLDRRPVQLYYDLTYSRHLNKIKSKIPLSEMDDNQKSKIEENISSIIVRNYSISRKICELLKSNTLLSLIPSLTDEQNRNLYRPALLKLRTQFSQNFDDLFYSIKKIREKRYVYYMPTIIVSLIVIPFILSWLAYSVRYKELGEDYIFSFLFNLAGVAFVYSSLYLVWIGISRLDSFSTWFYSPSSVSNLLRALIFHRSAPILVLLIYTIAVFETGFAFYEWVPDFFTSFAVNNGVLLTALPVPTYSEVVNMWFDVPILVGSFVYIFGLFFCIYVEWFLKRRKTLKYLVNTKGTLQIGNIYTRVIERIYLNEEGLKPFNITNIATEGFVDSIKIIQDRLDVEINKRFSRFLITAMGLIIALLLAFQSLNVLAPEFLIHLE